MRARNLFVEAPGKIRGRYRLHLLGYVVMPEHVHLLISEPKRGTPSTVMQKSKLRVSRKMRKRRKLGGAEQLPLPFEEGGEPPRAFWQPRFNDFNVCTEGKKAEKLQYMQANPATRRLLKHPKDLPGSIWSFYRKGEPGLIRIDAEE